MRMSFNNIETFKDKMRDGQLCVGTDITFSDPAVGELLADVGYDFVWIDMEHNPLSLSDVAGHIMAVRGSGTAALVRVPWNDPILMKPILELAPAGIILPMVNTAEEAESAVKACKYPPNGARGFGPRRGNRYGNVDLATYIKEADKQTMVLIQIEHIEGVQNLDAIVATPGLDGICIGPMDLSASMGLLGQLEHPDVVAAIDTIAEKMRASDLFFGISCGYLGEAAAGWLEKGVQWISYSTDVEIMCSNSRRNLAEIKETHKNLTKQ